MRSAVRSSTAGKSNQPDASSAGEHAKNRSMLVHQRPFRSPVFRDSKPSFPAVTCVITAQLGPAEVFGKAPPSDRLRTVAGRAAKLGHHSFSGGIRVTSTQHLPTQKAQLSFFGFDLLIDAD